MRERQARKRTTTSGSACEERPLTVDRDESGSSSSSSSPSASHSPLTAYHHHNSDGNLNAKSHDYDDEGIALLPLLSSSAPTKSSSGCQHCDHCKHRPQIVISLSCIRSILCRPRSTKQKLQLCLCILITLIFTIFCIEKLVFAVRFVTMGRPAILYGSPMEWKDVKGCLSQNFKQELVDFKRSTRQADAVIPPQNLNPNVVWNWYRYSSNSTAATTENIPKRRLLIAQYSGFGSYSKILQEVEPVNRAYAKKWGHDYATLQGTALQFPGLRYGNETDDGNTDQRSCPNLENGYEAQSTFNKIPLLLKALELTSSSSTTTDAESASDENDNHHGYDQVLILDTDTMIVDLDYDITSLLLPDEDHDDATTTRTADDEYFLSAYRVWLGDWHWTWDINAGINLWNLRHPTTQQVAKDWLQRSLTHPKDILLKNDDQFFLQRALMKLGWWKRLQDGVRAVRGEFEYYDATLIKHFKRDARSWSRTSLEQRLLRIQESKATVCEQWAEDCATIEQEMASESVDNE